MRVSMCLTYRVLLSSLPQHSLVMHYDILIQFEFDSFYIILLQNGPITIKANVNFQRFLQANLFDGYYDWLRMPLLLYREETVDWNCKDCH